MSNGHALEIVGIGTIKLKLFDGTIHTIQGVVQHMKGLKKNLLFLGQLEYLGCKTHIENGIMKIIKGVLVVMKPKKIVENIFILLEDTLQEAYISLASSSEEESIAMWHRKQGHMFD